MKTKKNLDFFFDRFVIEQGNSGPNFMLIAHSYLLDYRIVHLVPIGRIRIKLTIIPRRCGHALLSEQTRSPTFGIKYPADIKIRTEDRIQRNAIYIYKKELN